MKTNRNSAELDRLIPTNADYSALLIAPRMSREVYVQMSDGSGYSFYPSQNYSLNGDFIQKLEDAVQEYDGSLDQIARLSARGMRGGISGEVEKFRQLTGLHLRYNIITGIPKEIGYLTNLNGLDLSHNGIARIPKEIGYLTNLNGLDLSHNGITEIPKELGNLTNLNGLDLSHNGITEIPKELGNLLLRWLDLRGNPLTRIPKNLEYRAIHDGNIKPALLYRSEHSAPRKMVAGRS